MGNKTLKMNPRGCSSSPRRAARTRRRQPGGSQGQGDSSRLPGPRGCQDEPPCSVGRRQPQRSQLWGRGAAAPASPDLHLCIKHLLLPPPHRTEQRGGPCDTGESGSSSRPALLLSPAGVLTFPPVAGSSEHVLPARTATGTEGTRERRGTEASPARHTYAWLGTKCLPRHEGDGGRGSQPRHQFYFLRIKKKSPNRQNFLKTASYLIISQKLAWKHHLLSPCSRTSSGLCPFPAHPFSWAQAMPAHHRACGVTAACPHVPVGSQQCVPMSPCSTAELNPCSHPQGLPGRGQEGLGSPTGLTPPRRAQLPAWRRDRVCFGG